MAGKEHRAYLEFGSPDSFIYKRVDDINSFQMTVDFPMIADWTNESTRARLQDRLHDEVIALLQRAEFYSESRLEQTRSADSFAISYNDDIFDFRITVHQNKIVITKSGLRMATFHDWYLSAIPGIRTLISSLLDLMEEVLHRKMNLTGVFYSFGFLTYDFHKDGKKLRNLQVLSRLITKVPGDDGMIEAVESSKTDISRTDYKVNTWEVENDGRRLVMTYDVAAPANRNYSGLWFNFHFATETYKDPDTGIRSREVPDQMLERYDDVYNLLWQKGIGGFMKSLLDGLDFKTTATYIP